MAEKEGQRDIPTDGAIHVPAEDLGLDADRCIATVHDEKPTERYFMRLISRRPATRS
jgi:hypothetical protein